MDSPRHREKPLHLQLFGTFRLTYREKDAPAPRSRRTHWMLALLVLRRGQAVERDWIAETLWRDADRTNALFYLRRSLTELRKMLGDEAHRLKSPSIHTLQFDTSGIECDLLAFTEALQCADRASIEQAVSLYEGDLLEGCQEEWVFAERAHYERQYLSALEQLASEAAVRSAWETATDWLRKLIVCEPERESAQQRLMEALAAQGDFAGVERQYRELRRALRSELNLEPSAETVQCYQRLKTQPQTPAPASPSLPHRLPLPLTSLVGREQERAEIAAALQTSRLVTLLGPGGVGKTRLSLAVAEDAAASFAHGVWFADLAPVMREETLLQAVLASLDCQPFGDVEPLEALCRFLQRKHLLLLLDNAEHLCEACARLSQSLLQKCPLLTILCTSREPLGISGEVVRSVVPLAVPPETEPNCSLSEQEIAAYDSVALLLTRIAAAAPAFRLTSHNAAAIVQICRRLDGLPLALELVAARFRTLSAPEIAVRLDNQFRLLTGGDPSNPRHRTLRNALDWSYTLLDEAERRLLRSVSVFAGGWTLEAAEAVCSDENEDICALLLSLADKSGTLDD